MVGLVMNKEQYFQTGSIEASNIVRKFIRNAN